jgi:DNA-binding response OmpR family regulator
MARVTLLEDEAIVREELAAFLNKRAHTVTQAGTLAEFWPLMATTDIAILDLMLPDGSGLDAAAQLRQHVPRAGVIVLTARGAIQDRVQGLNGGADHYLVKPFRLLELAAIIDALLRRLGGGWRIAFQQRELIGPDGYRSTLSATEMVLFELLCASPGQVVSRRALIAGLGEDWRNFDERRLDQLISRLRRRWRDGCGQELPLKTEHRKGYSFGEMIHRL